MFLTSDLQSYVSANGSRQSDALARLREETESLPQAHYQILPEQGQLLRFLIEITDARRVLDIGTFTGYSALAAALALPPGGEVVTFDVSEDFSAIAQRHWETSGVGDKISLRLGPAAENLERLIAAGEDGGFDLAFIDADKESYAVYYEQVLTLLRPGGVAMIDNTLWRGRVADAHDSNPRTVAMRALNRHIHADDRVTPVLLPVGDGVTLVRKRP